MRNSPILTLNVIMVNGFKSLSGNRMPRIDCGFCYQLIYLLRRLGVHPPLLVAGLCFFLMIGISWQVGAYDEDDLEILKATGDCSACDLSEANLTGTNLYGADLTGADLSGADLMGANLKGAKMRGTILCNTTMPNGSIIYSNC